jgi:hypothetical protein
VPAPYEEVDVKKEWLVPLTGVVFVALGVVGFSVGGEPPDADEPVREIIDHYVDNKDSVRIGALAAGLAVLSLIFFGGYVRKVLAAAEGPGGMLSALALVGTTITLSLAEAVEDIDPAAVQALQALWDNDFIPIALGTLVFLLSTGISIVRYGALPKWLGWVAILLAVVGPTPIGFASFLGGGIWILVVSVLLALRARSAGATGGPTAAAA